MGLFNRLLREGTKALGDVIAEQGSKALREALSDQPNRASVREPKFEEKLKAIVDRHEEYELQGSISPDELEREAGREIYTRKNGWCRPDPISFCITRYGARALLINIWDDYGRYKRTANREIRKYCDENGIRVLDFFRYLPNETDYMEERIMGQLQ